MNNGIEVCKICESSVESIFTAKVLHKYNAKYYKCTNCGFIQTEMPYWLDEAYSSAIASIDVGLVQRNIFLSGIIESIISNNFNCSGKFLDFGGGYGLFVRLMRDKGFEFYREDKYCPNLFAKYFDLTDLPLGVNFELVTGFELFEHLVNPLEEIERILSFSDSILFSTELQPETDISSPKDWWYFVPESGQHVAFYKRKTLEYIAKIFNCNFYSNNQNIHLMTKKSLKMDPFIQKLNSEITLWEKIKNKLQSGTKEKTTIIKLETLLMKDFEFVKGKVLEESRI